MACDIIGGGKEMKSEKLSRLGIKTANRRAGHLSGI